ncbi:hypothetical protein FOL47_002483, partial [Perkinsus chesapeaki]
MRSKVVGFETIRGPYTADNIRGVLAKSINALDLGGKIRVAVSDSASSMKKCFEDIFENDEIPGLLVWLPCAAHRLHLVVVNGLGLYRKSSTAATTYERQSADGKLIEAEQTIAEMEKKKEKSKKEANSEDVLPPGILAEAESDAEEEEPSWMPPGNDDRFSEGVEVIGRSCRSQTSVRRAVEKTRSLMSLLRSSTTARDIMVSVRARFPPKGKGGTSYCGDTVTRWNSTLKMIEQVLDYRVQYEEWQRSVEENVPPSSPVYKVVESCRLSHGDYRVLESIRDVLHPFKLCITWLGGSRYPTLPSLMVAIGALRRHLESEESSDNRVVCDLKEKLLERIAFYFAYLGEEAVVVCGCYLNPITRRQTVNPHEKYQVSDEVGREAAMQCLEAFGLELPNTDNERADSSQRSAQESEDKLTFDNLINDFVQSSTPYEDVNPLSDPLERAQAIMLEYEARARKFVAPSDKPN